MRDDQKDSPSWAVELSPNSHGLSLSRATAPRLSPPPTATTSLPSSSPHRVSPKHPLFDLDETARGLGHSAVARCISSARALAQLKSTHFPSPLPSSSPHFPGLLSQQPWRTPAAKQLSIWLCSPLHTQEWRKQAYHGSGDKAHPRSPVPRGPGRCPAPFKAGQSSQFPIPIPSLLPTFSPSPRPPPSCRSLLLHREATSRNFQVQSQACNSSSIPGQPDRNAHFWTATVEHSELCSTLRGSLDGREVWGRTDTCTCMVESLRGPPETITTLLISYIPTQNKKLKKKKKKRTFSAHLEPLAQRSWPSSASGFCTPRGNVRSTSLVPLTTYKPINLWTQPWRKQAQEVRGNPLIHAVDSPASSPPNTLLHPLFSLL